MPCVIFKERGERNVSTSHIAVELNIRPGNFYDHFRNKHEIVFQLFLRLPGDGHVSFEDKMRYMNAILCGMWDYRFLHRDLQHLLQDNEALRVAYCDFSSSTVEDRRRILQGMASGGILDITPEQIDALALFPAVSVTPE